MDLKEIGWESFAGLFHVAQDKDEYQGLVSAEKNPPVSLNTGNFFSS